MESQPQNPELRINPENFLILPMLLTSISYKDSQCSLPPYLIRIANVPKIHIL